MSVPLAPGTWTIDPTHSTVQYAIRHLGISFHRGRFNEFSAAMDVGQDLNATSLSAEVGMGSIDTGNEDRNGHVRSSDIFNAEANPKMTFASTLITPTGESTYSVEGDLSINGQTRSEVLTVEMVGTEDNPLDGSHRVGFTATGRINREDYGIDWNVPLASGGAMLGKDVDIIIDAQLLAPSTDSA